MDGSPSGQATGSADERKPENGSNMDGRGCGVADSSYGGLTCNGNESHAANLVGVVEEEGIAVPNGIVGDSANENEDENMCVPAVDGANVNASTVAGAAGLMSTAMNNSDVEVVGRDAA